jgi:hypothetical protein
MDSQLLTASLTGAFGLCGVLSGVLLSGRLARRTDQQRITNEDERRWLSDRRHAYATYLGLIVSMLKDLDKTSSFLSYDGTEPVKSEDEPIIAEDSLDFYTKWDDELQPVLGDVQLLASPRVAELADRTSWALMELNGMIDSQLTYDTVTKFSYKTRYLIDATRNAMRAELGLTDPIKTFPMPRDWPWLEDESDDSNREE